MQRIQGNQCPLIEDNPNNHQQRVLPAPARPYLRFVGWQMVGLLATGTAVGVSSGVQCYRNISQRLNAQEATINELQRRLESLEIEPVSTRSIVSLQKEQLIHKQDISELKKQQLQTTLYLHHKLTTAVALGNQEQAEAIIQQNPDLLLMAGDVTDCGYRKFKQITPFQYAVWALDWHMWEMLRKYMPKDIILEQIKGLNNGEWVVEHGAQVSWQGLIDAFQESISKYTAQNVPYWIQKIGGTQLLLPAHVIQEYNMPTRLLVPCPAFNENLLTRTSIEPWKMQNHKGHNKVLGIDFAWTRGSRSQAAMVDDFSTDSWCQLSRVHQEILGDIVALKSLFNIRVAQRVQLIASIDHKNRPQPNP